jgi:hypothetical protein
MTFEQLNAGVSAVVSVSVMVKDEQSPSVCGDCFCVSVRTEVRYFGERLSQLGVIEH